MPILERRRIPTFKLQERPEMWVKMQCGIALWKKEREREK